jgi:hypothetical protein
MRKTFIVGSALQRVRIGFELNARAIVYLRRFSTGEGRWGIAAKRQRAFKRARVKENGCLAEKPLRQFQAGRGDVCVNAGKQGLDRIGYRL